MRRPVAEQRGPEASLSAGMSSEPRGRMLPDIESRAVGGPSVQDWRGDGPRPVGAEGSHMPWPKDRPPGPVQEPPGMGQRGGIVEGEPLPPWQSKESDPAITTAQQRPPPRHVPGEPWRQQPGPQRYGVMSSSSCVLLLAAVSVLYIGVAGEGGALGAIAPKNPILAEHQKPKAGRPYSVCTFRAFV